MKTMSGATMQELRDRLEAIRVCLDLAGRMHGDDHLMALSEAVYHTRRLTYDAESRIALSVEMSDVVVM